MTAPPYVAKMNAIIEFIDGLNTPERFYAFLNAPKYLQARQMLPQNAQGPISGAIQRAKKRLGIKGDSNARMAG